jgi:hypothetical protein
MNKKLLLIPIAVIIIIAAPFLAFYFRAGQGAIGSEIWNGTINVTGDAYVRPWATLTIMPGTTIYISPLDKAPKFSTEVLPDGFNDNDPTRLKEYDETHISISGKIIALGTKEKPIIFTSAATC